MRLSKLIYIGNQLSKKGATVTSIETLGSFLVEEGYSIVKASNKKNKLLRLLHMLSTVVYHARSTKFVLIDTYSTQNFWYAVAVGNICRLLKLPYIPILRGGDLPARIERSKLQSHKLFHSAKVNIAPSEYLLKAFEEAGYDNLQYIPNTITIENYPFKERKTMQPRLLWVRSFAKIYNPILAIKVFQKLRVNYPEASLTMVGPDKDGSLEQCRAFAKQEQLPVKFTGKLSKQEWTALAASHDIFLNTTNFDNTPVSVIEAMALGLVVISTNVGGMPYLITHNEEGVLVAPNNVDLIVNEIKSLCNDPDRAHAITLAARKKVVNFDWQVVKAAWNLLLQD